MGAARAKAPAAPDPAFLKSEIFTTPFFQSFIFEHHLYNTMFTMAEEMNIVCI
jgi:hypothetical protein